VNKEELGTELLTYLLTYSLTHSLTPWCRIFEKLNVTQFVKKYPAFLWNPKVHYRVYTSPPLDPILSQLNPVRPIDPRLRKVHADTDLLLESLLFTDRPITKPKAR
jgi:hypothetical protein